MLCMAPYVLPYGTKILNFMILRLLAELQN